MQRVALMPMVINREEKHVAICNCVFVAFSDFAYLIFSAAEAMARVPGMAWSVLFLSSADAMLGRVSSAVLCLSWTLPWP